MFACKNFIQNFFTNKNVNPPRNEYIFKLYFCLKNYKIKRKTTKLRYGIQWSLKKHDKHIDNYLIERYEQI